MLKTLRPRYPSQSFQICHSSPLVRKDFVRKYAENSHIHEVIESDRRSHLLRLSLEHRRCVLQLFAQPENMPIVLARNRREPGKSSGVSHSGCAAYRLGLRDVCCWIELLFRWWRD